MGQNSNILKYFAGDPRRQQEDGLIEFADKFHRYSAFIIQGPVAVGKMHMADCASAWIAAEQNLTSAVCAPTSIHVGQYARNFSDLPTLHKSTTYANRQAFERARYAAKDSPRFVGTYYSYVANRLWRDCVFCDEGHTVLGMISDRHALRLWQRVHNYPDNMQTMGDVLQWLEQYPKNKKLKKIRSDILTNRTYTVRYTKDLYKGKEEPVLKLIPLSTREKSPWLWSPRTKKIIMMSATINEQDVWEMGLDKRRVCYIQLSSPIPPVNRLVYYEPIVDMRYANRDSSVKRLAQQLHRDLEHKQGKGIIHCTYDVAARLRGLLRHPRLVWHNRDNKKSQYKSWWESRPEEGRVFVGCGLSEGIDLAYDAARWQIATQVVYPDKSDQAVQAKIELDPNWYPWQAIRHMRQLIGRVSRAADDKGETTVYDSQFGPLLRYKNMWTQDELNSIVGAGRFR